MSSGLIALLDDVAALAKMAAATLDDAGAQAAKAGSKAAGIVIDDAAVTPRYVVGIAAERELPIIRKIATGSLRNKLLFLLPGALALSALAPWAITPLLMLGGGFLCLEGYHKVADLMGWGGHDHHGEPEADVDGTPLTPQELEDERVGSAIRTDFILSAEIMAIALSTVATAAMWMQAVILAVVAVAMTVLVYGAVALIVKADDVGVALAQSRSAAVAALGRGIVAGMPGFLKALSLVGMVAMLWVGGGIVIHGLHGLGWHQPEEIVHHWAQAAGALVPGGLSGVVSWFVTAGSGAVLGLVLGALINPLATHAIAPAWTAGRRMAARIRGAAQ